MKEIILTLCFMNPCIDVPNENIMLVPVSPAFLHPMTHPDDSNMFWCEDCGKFIKWVHIAQEV